MKQFQVNLESSSSKEANAVRVKLPVIELPKFDGNKREFYGFWNLFQSTVDRQPISGAEKFVYLEKCLIKDAKPVIRDFTASEENYNNVVDLLKRRFGDREIIEALLYEDLSKLKPIFDTSSYQVQQNFMDQLEKTVRSLQNLGIPTSQIGRAIKSEIYKKLPFGWKLEYERIRSRKKKELELKDDCEDDATSISSSSEYSGEVLSEFLEFMREEISLRMRASQGSEDSKEDRRRQFKEVNKFDRSSNSEHSGSTASFAFHSTVEESKHVTCCIFCSGEHNSRFCKKNVPVEKRREIIKEKGVCFSCFKPGHRGSRCRLKIPCKWCTSMRHSELICFQQQEEASSTSQNSKETTGCLFQNKGGVLLMTATATLISSESQHVVRVFLDPGSTTSFVKKDLSRKLKCAILAKRKMNIAMIGGVHAEGESNVVQLNLKTDSGEMVKINAVEIEKLVEPFSKCEGDWINEAKSMGVILADKGLTSDMRREVDILLGGDVYKDVMKFNIPTVKLKAGPVLQPTFFGHVAIGPCGKKSSSELIHCNFVQSIYEESDITSEFQKVWHDDMKELEIEQVDPTMEFFERTIKYNEGRYSVSLPWKSPKPLLLNNHEIAEKRLDRLERKLTEEQYEKYNNEIVSLETMGFVERVNTTTKTVYYLPHHPVFRENKSTSKVRPVFDGSCKGKNGISLNSCLEPGPSLLPDLSILFTDWRRHEIGITADISKAFLMLGIEKESDRDCLRFLWNGQEFRFKRLCFGLNSAPFLLQATLRHHFDIISTKLADELKFRFYMDDLLDGSSSVDEGCQRILKSKEMLKDAGMNLCKFRSNNACLNAFVRDVLNEEICFDEKVLGLSWNIEDDSISVSAVDQPFDGPWTKRRLLKVLASAFDPLGVCSGVLLTGKLLLQRLWVEKIDWDKIIVNPVTLNEIKLYLEELRQLDELKIPRYLGGVESTLHVFCDASTKGLIAVAYVRDESGAVNFIRAKNRIAPVDVRMTLPKLELQSCLMGAQLTCTIASSFPGALIRLYTDSTIALNWICGDLSKRKEILVKNRVLKIRNLIADLNYEWFHVNGVDNPADKGTRPCRVVDLKNSMWLKGPQWLQDSDKWSHCVNSVDDSLVPNEDLCLAIKDESKDETIRYGLLEVLDSSSDYTTLIRRTAWCLRFVNNIRRKKSGESLLRGELSSEELKTSEIKWIYWIQQEAFNEGLSSSCLKKLDPQMLDEVLVVGGRLGAEGKHQYILPKCHAFVNLLVRHIHKKVGHFGISYTLSALRKHYWILSGRNTVKKILKKCSVCNRFQGRPCSEKFGPLPPERLKFEGVFCSVGVDYAGPIALKDRSDVYLALFTCLNVRAVHLEIAHGLSAEEFVNVFRRFVSRRGLPRVVYSDNALCFRSSATQKFVANRGIVWKFIPPRSPWVGGVYERMIGVVKKCLWKTLGKASLNLHQLNTVVTEVEALVNSRPLSYVGSDDEMEAITPSHFLIGRTFLTPAFDEHKCLNDVESFSRKWRHQLTVLNHFARRWRMEYLEMLPKVSNCFSKPVKVGDVCVIGDDNSKRLFWKLGVVKHLYVGSDGLSRVAVLRTNHGDITRALPRLHKLEVCASDIDSLCDDFKLSKSSKIENEHSVCDINEVKDIEFPVKTRSGRLVRNREILDL